MGYHEGYRWRGQGSWYCEGQMELLFILREWSKEDKGVGIARGLGRRGGGGRYCEGVEWIQGGS